MSMFIKGVAILIKVNKEYDGLWIVWNSENNKMANIIQYEDKMLGNTKKLYRIDISGKTKVSMLDHFQTAKKTARKFVL